MSEAKRQKLLKGYQDKFPLLEQEMDKILNVKWRKKRIEEAKHFFLFAAMLKNFEDGNRRAMIQEQGSAVKTFEVKEGSIRGGRYRITVTFHGKVVDVFTEDTMRQARLAFYRAGYQFVAWAEGPRIVCQGENFE